MLVVKGADSTVRYNTGTQFLAPEPFLVPFYPRLGKQDYDIADIDGDGAPDVMSRTVTTAVDVDGDGSFDVVEQTTESGAVPEGD